MTTKTTKFEVADYLDDDDMIVVYLTECLDDEDPALFQKALGEVAKAKGMGKVAASAGTGRTSLYKALSENGNPEFKTILGALKPLGFKLSVERIAA
jgi:probable addiction module antidote protein